MLQDLTRTVMEGRHLSGEEAEQGLEMMLSDETPDVAIASFLSALAIKGETAEEIAGFAKTMRKHVIRIHSHHATTIDTAGTGGGLDTFNISTTAAFVIAGAGLAVAKHGNRAITSRCGSADVLRALGVNIAAPADVAEQCLNDLGLTFMFAPLYHPTMKRVADIRRQIGHRTVFNLLGPLTNPAGAPCQIVGVYSPLLTEKLSHALSLLDCRRAWVVHSQDGLDELSTGAPSRVSGTANGETSTFEFDPRMFGICPADLSILRGGTVEENARLTRGILEGRVNGAAREVVVLNAAAALHLGLECGFADALQKAEESINSGAAVDKLEKLKQAYA